MEKTTGPNTTKNFFNSVTSFHQSQRSGSLHSQTPSGHRHPILDLKLGREFLRGLPGEYRVVVEGREFGKAEVGESSRLELVNVPVEHLEPMPATISILKQVKVLPVYTGESDRQQHGDGLEGGIDEYDIHGMKHIILNFGKEFSTYKVMCGSELDQCFTVTLRLYC